MKPQLIVIGGPTAVGKTKVAIEIAKELGAEVFSADSRQFYRGLDIGTAKPTLEEMDGVVHHFIDSHQITDYFSVGHFAEELDNKLIEYFKTHSVGILVGGSGLYIKAAIHGIDYLPEVDPEIRNNLSQILGREGVTWFQSYLKDHCPEVLESIDPKNVQRVFRAVEVYEQTGQPITSFFKKDNITKPWEIVKIGLETERSVLYDRINQRVDQMISHGLENEARSFEKFRNINALKTVGYSEFFDYFDGDISYEKCIELIKQNSRRYAKRQLTWFKNKDSFDWFSPTDNSAILDHIKKATFQ